MKINFKNILPIWPYDYMAILPYGPMALDIEKAMKIYLIKVFNWLVFLVRNESKNDLMGYFPLYNFEFPL